MTEQTPTPRTDPTCSFRRNGNIWIMEDDCVGGVGKVCPAIPNSQRLNETSVQNPGLEPAFLTSFQRALGNDAFTFQEGDVLKLNCSPTAGTTTKTLEYLRNIALNKHLEIKPGQAGQAPEVVVVQPSG